VTPRPFLKSAGCARGPSTPRMSRAVHVPWHNCARTMTRPSPTLELTKPPPPPHVGSDRATQAAESSGSAIYMTPSSMAFVVYDHHRRSSRWTSNFSCNRTKTAFKVSSGDGVKTRMLSSRSSDGNNQHGGMCGARIRRIHTSTRLRPERRMGTKD